MSKKKQTPGPWFYNEGLGEITDKPEYPFGRVIAESVGLSDADGHLIAAAPDLLEACKDALAWLDAQPIRTGTAATLRNAIAKAKGAD